MAVNLLMRLHRSAENDLWFLFSDPKIRRISILPDKFCIARFRHQAIRINSACLPPHRYLSTWFYMSPYVTLRYLILSSHFELMLHSSQWPGFGRWKRLTPRCTGWASPQDEAQESRGAWGDVISEGVVHQQSGMARNGFNMGATLH